jgi:hypothetical protein
VGPICPVLPHWVPSQPHNCRHVQRGQRRDLNLKLLPPQKRHRSGPRHGLCQPPSPRHYPCRGPTTPLRCPRRLRPPLREPPLPLSPPIQRCRRQHTSDRERRHHGLQGQHLRHQLGRKLHLESQCRRRLTKKKKSLQDFARFRPDFIEIRWGITEITV